MNIQGMISTIFKSMFYQANWNYINMQGTGFSWLVKDMLKRNNVEYPKDINSKIPEYFNTNPYLVTFILGMILREAKDTGNMSEYTQIYASAFGALGDTFFWHSLRPFVFFLSVGVTIYNPYYAVLLYLLIYNMFNIGFRIFGFYYGYKLSYNVIMLFRKIKFNNWSKLFDGCSTFMAGFSIMIVLKLEMLLDIISLSKVIILFLLGFISAKVLKAYIGFIIASIVLVLMLLFGV